MQKTTIIRKHLAAIVAILLLLLAGCANRALQQAAESGNAQAQYELCFKYGAGIGVPLDYQKALNWCRLSAAQGHSLAKTTLERLEHGSTPTTNLSPPPNQNSQLLDKNPQSQASRVGSLPSNESGGWLAEPERDFFAAFALDVRINGNNIKRKATIDDISGIIEHAKDPFRTRLIAINKALDKMKMTPDEKRQYDKYVQDGENSMNLAILESLANKNLFEAAGNILNKTAKGADLVGIWKMQRQHLERSLLAQKEFDIEMKKLVDALKKRIGPMSSSTNLACNISTIYKYLHLDCQAKTPSLTQPILLVQAFKIPTHGQLVKAHLSDQGVGKMMGVDAMTTPQATQERIKLAALEEERNNLSDDNFMLLPNLNASALIEIPLSIPDKDASRVDHIEVRLLSAEGWYETMIGSPR